MKLLPATVVLLLAGCMTTGEPPSAADGPASTPGTHRRLHEHNNQQLVAAFNDNDELKRRYPQADLIARHGDVAIWQLPMTAQRWQELRSAGRYSPVFGLEQGQMRALPGGVLIRLKPGMTEQQSRDWFRAQNLETHPVGAMKNTYLVQTPAGLPALEIAERLKHMPEVASSEPNWWRPRAMRR